jgi:general secretion pathway protein D
VRTFYKEVSVVADKTTNSLIIIATPQDYTVLKRVIDQLDVMRPQVLVETLIAEVSMDFTRKLGVQWLAANPRGKDHGFIGVNEGGGALVAEVAKTLIDPASIAPTVPSGISVGYFHFDGEFLKGFIELNANETDDDFNVLSAPHVLTLDNEKAIINISDNVPFITSRLTDSTGSDALAQSETFEYRDVGIVLEITPHISPDRMVRLEILQKVNDVSQVASGLSAGALSEIKREAQTTVMVKDRHTLVLGGLMKDTDNVSYTKVPFLGDIPILGWAFKSKSVTRGKTNLLIFITPSIVTSVAEATELTLEKTSEAGEELRERMKDAPTFQRSKFLGKKTGAIEDAPYEAGPK